MDEIVGFLQVGEISAVELRSALGQLKTMFWRLGPIFVSDLTRGYELASPDPYIYRAYAEWYNVGHPARKLSHRRLSKMQQEQAVAMWFTGSLHSGYLPRKLRMARDYLGPAKPPKRPFPKRGDNDGEGRKGHYLIRTQAGTK